MSCSCLPSVPLPASAGLGTWSKAIAKLSWCVPRWLPDGLAGWAEGVLFVRGYILTQCWDACAVARCDPDVCMCARQDTFSKWIQGEEVDEFEARIRGPRAASRLGSKKRKRHTSTRHAITAPVLLGELRRAMCIPPVQLGSDGVADGSASELLADVLKSLEDRYVRL